jgi:hypothetical protein
MKARASTAKSRKEPRLSRTHAPPDLPPADWQRGLRRQFGREQTFGLENLGTEPFFSEFRVSNPQSKSGYHVAIRGLRPSDNYCSCPDYATNELGTCKHIEFVLAVLKAAARLFDAEHGWVLPPERFAELEGFLAAIARTGHELRAYDDALDFIAGRRDAERRAAVLDRVFPGGGSDPQLKNCSRRPFTPIRPKERSSPCARAGH